ncbi:hypothetical protein V9K92_02070 [Phyllobacterium sp. CCNWLW109]
MSDTDNFRRIFMALAAAAPAALALRGTASAQTSAANPRNVPGAGRAALLSLARRAASARPLPAFWRTTVMPSR